MLQGFGPPPATLVTPGDRSEPVPLAPTMPRAPMPRAPLRGQDAREVARANPRSAARSVRPPLPDRKRKAEGGSVGGGVGLIVGGVAAAVAAGGAVWYFLLG